jgi:hypothetical protein
MTQGRVLRSFFPLESPSKNLFSVAMAVVAAALIIDISLNYLAESVKVGNAIWPTVVLVILVPIFGIGQYLILRFVQQKNKEILEKTPHVKTISRIATIVYPILTALLVLIVLQIVISSMYSTIILIVSSTINYALAGIVMGIFSFLFISWYKSNKNFTVLMYGLAAIAVVSSLLLGAILTDAALLNLPPERNALSEAEAYFFEDIILGTIGYLFGVSNAVNYFLLWISTALLLRNYSKKIGPVKFWVIMSIPIVVFINVFVVVSPLIESFSANPDTNLVYLTIFGSVLPGIVGGIVFGLPFWVASRTVRNSIVRDYMVIAAWGSIFLQFTTAAGIAAATYPPFGLFSVLLTALSCYLILIGIYCSAVSVSIDAKLRRSIRKNTEDELRFLSDLGRARVAQELEEKVFKIVKENSDTFIEESGVHPSLTEENARQYIEDILNELDSKKKTD